MIAGNPGSRGSRGFHDEPTPVNLGRVRRRFFRRPDGGPGTRADVEAERVVVGRDRRRLATMLRSARVALESLDPRAGGGRGRRKAS